MRLPYEDNPSKQDYFHKGKINKKNILKNCQIGSFKLS